MSRAVQAGLAGLLGLGLRLARVPQRWCATAWLYAAYPYAHVEALGARDAAGLLAWSGLHPPLWPLLHAAGEQLLPIPLLALLASALASSAAVGALAAAAPLAGLLLATGPLSLAYAAEVNGYPLAQALVAALLVLRAPAARGRLLPLVAIAILAAWTHALAGLAAALVLLTLPRPAALRGTAALALGTLPLLPGLLQVLRAGGAFAQPPWKPDLVAAAVVDRFGLLWALLLPLAAYGARRAPWLLVPTGGLALAIAALTAAGAAAPHQFPYWLLVAPGYALLVAEGARGRRAGTALALGVAALHGALALGGTVQAHRALRAAEAPGVAAARASLQTPWTCVGPPSPACSGDALYLVFAHTVDDDDKRRLDPGLALLSPARPMPIVRPYAGLDWGRYVHGQPRLVDGFVVYLEDHVRAELDLARAAHARLWVVAPAARAEGRVGRALAAHLGRAPERLGGDLVWPPAP